MDASDETGSQSPFSAGATPDDLGLKNHSLSPISFFNFFSISLFCKNLSFLELGLEEDLEGHNVLALLLPGKIHIPKFTFSKRTP